MGTRKRGDGGRWPSKEARQIAKAVEAAGGTVERTGQGHMKIIASDGRTAIVASRPETNRAGRGLAQTLKTIEQKTGLVIKIN